MRQSRTLKDKKWKADQERDPGLDKGRLSVK